LHWQARRHPVANLRTPLKLYLFPPSQLPMADWSAWLAECTSPVAGQAHRG
jgi:hypothetical protein